MFDQNSKIFGMLDFLFYKLIFFQDHNCIINNYIKKIIVYLLFVWNDPTLLSLNGLIIVDIKLKWIVILK